MNINILRYSLFGIAGQEVDRNFSYIVITVGISNLLMSAQILLILKICPTGCNFEYHE